jgi:hypothetical protein
VISGLRPAICGSAAHNGCSRCSSDDSRRRLDHQELRCLPLAVGVALGAIVSPPAAAAASTVLRRFTLPRQIDAVLKGRVSSTTQLLYSSSAVH